MRLSFDYSEEMKKLTLFSVILLVAAVPLGAAGQNIVTALALLGLLVASWQTRGRLRNDGIAPILIFSAYLLWMVIAALLNPEHEKNSLFEFIMGYLPIAVIPSLMGCGLMRSMTKKQKSLITNTIVAVIAIMGFCSITQALWGWERHGYWLVSGDTRARALFSHPLTLAYVGALIWPFALHWVFIQPRSWQGWLVFVSELVIIWSSRSRVVQLIALVFLLAYVWFYTQRRWRIALVAGLLAGLVLVAGTSNPVSRNFKKTLDGESDRHTSAYADDRLAFWDAHWHLFQERPLLGHGAHLPATARLRAYTAIGLPEFPKQYGAHNIYLQIAVEGGLIGLFIFLCWYGWFVREAWRYNRVVFQSLLLFAVACITQNGFQDAEVRYSLMLVLAGLLVLRK